MRACASVFFGEGSKRDANLGMIHGPVELTAVYIEGIYSVVRWGHETRSDAKAAAKPLVGVVISVHDTGRAFAAIKKGTAQPMMQNQDVRHLGAPRSLCRPTHVAKAQGWRRDLSRVLAQAR